MAILKIRNIGPIKDIDIELKRLNVFIGPQSSGKSTIAKVISFCQWLEKDCVRHQKTSGYGDAFVKEYFVDYHNMADYVSEESYFHFEGNILTITYDKGILNIKRAGGFSDAKLSKNAYIPSERNLISVPGIFSTRMPYNYILSFLQDWLQIRRKYKDGDSAALLPTGDRYYFNEKEDADMLVITDGKDIHLSQASSGLQSLTPLSVYIHYITDWIYSHKEQQAAEDEDISWQSALASVMDNEVGGEENDGILDMIDKADPSGDTKELFQRLLQHYRQAAGFLEEDEEVGKVMKRREELSRPYFSNLVIEEPEQNLFPQMQRQLIQYILRCFHPERDTMVLTTHSPFVLYALNNCLLGWLAREADPEITSDLTDIPPEAFVNPEDVNVWEIREGYIENYQGIKNTTIQDERGLIRDNYFDRVMKNVMTDFRNLMTPLS